MAHSGEGAVTLLADRLVRRVLRGFGEPRYAAVAPGSRHAFVTDSARGDVVGLDLVRAKAVGGVAVGEGARHVSIAPDGRVLWVALGTSAPELVSVDVSDPVRPRAGARLRPPFLAHDVACPGGRRLWVSAGDERRLAVFEPGRTTPLAIIHAGAAPQHVTFAGSLAFVSSGDDGTLHAHRTGDGRRLATAAVPAGSFNVQSAAGHVVTPSLAAGTLTLADAAGRIRHHAAVASAAHDACVL